MKGIMFNTKYGLESAVLNGNKNRTWRADKQPRYEVGEIVAIKQSYKDVRIYLLKEKKYIDFMADFEGQAGWRNKMFVKNELMPHHIRITAVKKCKMQDITEKECLREGIMEKIIRPFDKDEIVYCFKNSGFFYKTPKQAFADLIRKLNKKGFWEINPDGYAYEFELVK